jgi:hypothetical protein
VSTKHRSSGGRGIAVIIGTIVMVAGALGLASSAVAASMSAPSAVGAANGVDPELNKPSYWVDYFTGQGYEDVKCTKYEPVSTPYILGAAPEGRTWLAIIVKAGAGEDASAVTMYPGPGEYSHPSGKDNSHVIVCSIPRQTQTTTTKPPVTTTKPPVTTTKPPVTTTKPPVTTTTPPVTTTTPPVTTTTPPVTTTTPPVTTTTPPVTTTKPPVTTTTSTTTPPVTTTTTRATGPVVDTDLVSAQGTGAPSWLVGGSLAALVVGAGLVTVGLRQRGTHR